jgi:thiol:disulfide interchange protein
MFQCLRNTTIAVILLVSTGGLVAGAPPERLFRPLSLDNALVMAVKQKRVVFIDFSTSWCSACQRLDEDTWTNGKVIEQLKKKTIPIKLDADKERIITDKYKIKAYPTLLFLNPDGSVLARIVGYQIPAQFIETLQRVMATRLSKPGLKKPVA